MVALHRNNKFELSEVANFMFIRLLILREKILQSSS